MSSFCWSLYSLSGRRVMQCNNNKKKNNKHFTNRKVKSFDYITAMYLHNIKIHDTGSNIQVDSFKWVH